MKTNKKADCLKVGYSTHGYWSPLEEIKKAEVEERGNEWFEDDNLDLSQYEAIWVCLVPEHAVGYALLAEELGTEVHEEAKRHPLDYVIEVDLTGATSALEDHDEGYLYIRKRRMYGK
jgi:hypothetical protein